MSGPICVDVAEAIERARWLSASGRTLLGIAGPPGAGKSTLAEQVCAAVDGSILVGMDGFHLAHSILTMLGLVDRKGAPETFDAAGYLALLRRIRAADGVVWAPEFRREIEDAIAGAVPVSPSAPLIVTEGNYLLLPFAPWSAIPELLDEIWYVDLPDTVRWERLAARHERYGRTAAEALDRTNGSDERNAELVRGTRDRAVVVVQTITPNQAR